MFFVFLLGLPAFTPKPTRARLPPALGSVRRRCRHVTLSKWLRANDMPPPLLPLVCGYAPLASNVLKALQGGWGEEKQPAANPPEVVVVGSGERAGAAKDQALEDEAAVATAAVGKGLRSKVSPADAAVAARNPDVMDDAGGPAR